MRAFPVAAILTGLVAMAAGTAAAQPAADRRMQAALSLAVTLEAFTGPVDRHCGIFLLPEAQEAASADPEWPFAASRREMRAALRCVLAARKAGRSTWTLWQWPGEDSARFTGYATTAVSDVQVVQFDSRIADGPRLTPCVRPRINGDGEQVCRNLTGPLSTGDLERAVNRLRRDVVDTAGEQHAPLVTTARPATPGDGDGASDDSDELSRIVAGVQHGLQSAGQPHWPACPWHHDHALEGRDQRWYCARDQRFVADLGRLTRAGVPKVKK